MIDATVSVRGNRMFKLHLLLLENSEPIRILLRVAAGDLVSRRDFRVQDIDRKHEIVAPAQLSSVPLTGEHVRPQLKMLRFARLEPAHDFIVEVVRHPRHGASRGAYNAMKVNAAKGCACAVLDREIPSGTWHKARIAEIVARTGYLNLLEISLRRVTLRL